MAGGQPPAQEHSLLILPRSMLFIIPAQQITTAALSSLCFTQRTHVTRQRILLFSPSPTLSFPMYLLLYQIHLAIMTTSKFRACRQTLLLKYSIDGECLYSKRAT